MHIGRAVVWRQTNLCVVWSSAVMLRNGNRAYVNTVSVAANATADIERHDTLIVSSFQPCH